LIFGLALLPVGPEEKPLESFSAWQDQPNIRHPRTRDGEPIQSDVSFS